MSVALSQRVFATSTISAIDWQTFASNLQLLANSLSAGNITQDDLLKETIRNLEILDIQNTAFKAALTASYETGNAYWLWQRLLKQTNINGGVLTIDTQRAVPLHDHPGAIGVLRIISGEAELWQFDQLPDNTNGRVTLQRTSHRILKPGDIAILTPDRANIHALHALTEECRMLDFFIPPYRKKQRSWFEPLQNNWQAQETIECRCIPEYEFS